MFGGQSVVPRSMSSLVSNGGFNSVGHSMKRQLESCSGRNICTHSLPRRSYHHRNIDKSDPDDWWGASIGVARSHDRSAKRSSSRPSENIPHDESDFWYFHGADSQDHKRYYYHEYHYMNYYNTHTRQRNTNSRVNICSPENALEMASKSFAVALETAASELHISAYSDAKTEELENIISTEIGKVAEYCGSDIISFACVIGVLDSESVMGAPRDALIRKARRSIAHRFHPDKVNHLKDSGKRLSYLLGQSILQVLSTMTLRDGR